MFTIIGLAPFLAGKTKTAIPLESRPGLDLLGFSWLSPMHPTYKLRPSRYGAKPVAEKCEGQVGKSCHRTAILAANENSVNSA
jgi:hypothetical protein